MADRYWSRKGLFSRHMFQARVPARDWEPRPDQLAGVDWLLQHQAGGLALDPGAGKTATVWQAFGALRDCSTRRLRMLVVAPKTVCGSVWAQEANLWRHFRERNYSVTWISGDETARITRANSDSDVHLINPENCNWLYRFMIGKRAEDTHEWAPWDVVVLDELTRFKNTSTLVARAAHVICAGAEWKWGLSGTLCANGYIDLYGQMDTLGIGDQLAPTESAYKSRYFLSPEDGRSKKLVTAKGRNWINSVMSRYFLRASDETRKEDKPALLPSETEPNIRNVVLGSVASRRYEDARKSVQMKVEQGDLNLSMVASFPSAVLGKLLQVANGRVYADEDVSEDTHAVRAAIKIHSTKCDDLFSLIGELGGGQVMVAYLFKHDLDQIAERAAKENIRYGTLGGGVSAAQAQATIQEWDAGEIQLLAMHPASAGHGLNLQSSGCAHVVFFGPTFNLEHWLQAVRRVWRPGNPSRTVTSHVICAQGTVDYYALSMMLGKQQDLDSLHEALEIKGNSEMAFKPSPAAPAAIPQDAPASDASALLGVAPGSSVAQAAEHILGKAHAVAQATQAPSPAPAPVQNATFAPATPAPPPAPAPEPVQNATFAPANPAPAPAPVQNSGFAPAAQAPEPASAPVQGPFLLQGAPARQLDNGLAQEAVELCNRFAFIKVRLQCSDEIAAFLAAHSQGLLPPKEEPGDIPS